jgi:hypothetical protein
MLNRVRLLTVSLIALCLISTACSSLVPPSKPSIVITSPPSNSQFREGDTVAVQSTSTDSSGIVNVELVVDGNVVRTDPAPVAQASFTVIQNWEATIGQHTILVRAYNKQNVASDPAGINVSVSQRTPTATPPPTIGATATPLATPIPVCVNNAAFVADVTVPDGTVFAPGQTFNKIWRVRNTGNCAWSAGDQFTFVRGESMAKVTFIAVPATAPNATADFLVAMTAPTTPGKHTGEWKLKSKDGTLFGTSLIVTINVPAPTVASVCPFTPTIEYFNASPSTISAGQQATLSWGAVNGAESAEIDNNIGGVTTPGNMTVTPTSTTTYTLIATCGSKVRTAQVTITVQ